MPVGSMLGGTNKERLTVLCRVTVSTGVVAGTMAPAGAIRATAITKIKPAATVGPRRAIFM
jgi:hypothetical protein